MVNGHLLIVKLLGRKFKIINLATLEASLRSNKQRVNSTHTTTPVALQNNGPARSVQMIEF